MVDTATMVKISIHALREEGDGRRLLHSCCWTDFYPRPPRGGRPKSPSPALCTPSLFLSTPSARRATSQRASPARHLRDFYPRPPRGGRRPGLSVAGNAKDISIHALREEGDDFDSCRKVAALLFLSTPSARRATRQGFLRLSHRLFLSTPSARRATSPRNRCRRRVNRISIHALREEGDAAR